MLKNGAFYRGLLAEQQTLHYSFNQSLKIVDWEKERERKGCSVCGAWR